MVSARVGPHNEQTLAYLMPPFLRRLWRCRRQQRVLFSPACCVPSGLFASLSGLFLILSQYLYGSVSFLCIRRFSGRE